MVGKAKTTMQKHQQITDFQVLLIFNQQEDSKHRITLAQGDGIVVWEVQLAERRSPTRLVIACRQGFSYPHPPEGALCAHGYASKISGLAAGQITTLTQAKLANSAPYRWTDDNQTRNASANCGSNIEDVIRQQGRWTLWS